MLVKHYGIYLAYAPTVDLRHEGLGRYLAAFLKGAANRSDVRFVLVCPSWSRDSLEALFETEAVPQDRFEIVAPGSVPTALRLYQKWLAYHKRGRSASRLGYILDRLKVSKGRWLDLALQRIATADSMTSLALPLLLLTLLSALLLPIWFALGVGLVAVLVGRQLYRRYGRRLERIRQRLRRLIGQPKDDGVAVRMYRAMEQYEEQRMQALIEDIQGVSAWYSPTAFWPAFNEIKAPRLMCVPDVVLADFPVGFAGIGGDRFLQTFQRVEAAIRGGSHFVTYSDSVKWDTLVKRYAVDASNVSVVHHAPNDLSRWVAVRGLADEQVASIKYCRTLLLNAIQRSFNRVYTSSFENSDVKFFFYASQLRPNKNVITLLRAYEYLLRKRLIGHKLIMTGNPASFPAVQQFVKLHHLENDVLFLHGLKPQELAACYKLSDLAVNPSLSEGGCPFTFTEALSVDTPVVMARIPVTEEILNDPQLQEITFFDPYDWKDLARRIEWALGHREELLAAQRKTYAQLAQRTWVDVVDEHLQILDRISTSIEKETQA